MDETARATPPGREGAEPPLRRRRLQFTLLELIAFVIFCGLGCAVYFTGQDYCHPPPLRTLVGHTGLVLSLAFSPDGGRALSGGSDGTIRLWDLKRGTELLRLDTHAPAVGDVGFTPDGRHALSRDLKVRLWDLERGAEVPQLDAPVNDAYPIAFAPDGRYSAVRDRGGTVRLWDREHNAEVLKFLRRGDLIWGITGASAPDQIHFLLARDDGEGAIELREFRDPSPWPLIAALALTLDFAVLCLAVKLRARRKFSKFSLHSA